MRHIVASVKRRCLLRGREEGVEGVAAQQTIARMKRKKQLVLGNIEFVVRYQSAKDQLSSSAHLAWLSSIRKMEFGKQLMKRAHRYRGTQLNAQSVEQLLKMKQKYFFQHLADAHAELEGAKKGKSRRAAPKQQR